MFSKKANENKRMREKKKPKKKERKLTREKKWQSDIYYLFLKSIFRCTHHEGPKPTSVTEVRIFMRELCDFGS